MDGTGNKEQTIRIEGSGGLSEAEIEGMINEAAAHAEEDKAAREKVEKRNNLDSVIYQAEKMLSENGDKLTDADTEGIKSALEEAKQDLESDDLARIDAAHQRVEQQLHKVAEVLYQSQSANSEGSDGGGPADSAPADDGDVVDAEYTEEKDA